MLIFARELAPKNATFARNNEIWSHCQGMVGVGGSATGGGGRWREEWYGREGENTDKIL